MADNVKICLITGCSSGIGRAAAVRLAQKGYRIFAVVRDSEKSRAAIADIKREAGSEAVESVFTDLGSVHSIIKACGRISRNTPHIDVLINNAGVYKRTLGVSADGFELNCALHYIAPFVLVRELMPLLEKSPAARIINVGSEMYSRGKADPGMLKPGGKYDGGKAYASSKMMQLLYTLELAERLADEPVTVNCVHPGVAATGVFREYPGWFNRMLNLFIGTAESAAEPLVYLADSDEVAGVSGGYFNKTVRKEPRLPAGQTELRRALWTRAEDLLKECGA